MLVIGLTGSIGMGKSTTADMFRGEGVPVHDSDKAVHTLYAGEAVAPIGARFPQAIRDGAVDRRALSGAVLNDPEALRDLERIVHPLVSRSRDEFIARARTRGHSMCVLDIPLLYEIGAERLVDLVVVVTAGSAVQKQRVLAREGMTEEKFRAILARQTPDAEKRRRAHVMIDTSYGFELARRQVAALVRALSR